MPWVRANLELPHPTTLVNAHGRHRSHDDLRLMSACKHHIIANSSFSWWGAWLNTSPDKLVVAPKYWMCRGDTYYPEIFPAGWVCIDNRP